MSRRGPYRKHTRLLVKDERWGLHDVVTVSRTRWIIRRIAGTDVTLVASNRFPAVAWTTTLDCLPQKTRR